MSRPWSWEFVFHIVETSKGRAAVEVFPGSTGRFFVECPACHQSTIFFFKNVSQQSGRGSASFGRRGGCSELGRVRRRGIRRQSGRLHRCVKLVVMEVEAVVAVVTKASIRSLMLRHRDACLRCIRDERPGSLLMFVRERGRGGVDRSFLPDIDVFSVQVCTRDNDRSVMGT